MCHVGPGKFCDFTINPTSCFLWISSMLESRFCMHNFMLLLISTTSGTIKMFPPCMSNFMMLLISTTSGSIKTLKTMSMCCCYNSIANSVHLKFLLCDSHMLIWLFRMQRCELIHSQKLLPIIRTPFNSGPKWMSIKLLLLTIQSHSEIPQFRLA